MTAIGLVLQGGGALGAYEYGAVTHLVQAGLKPVAVTGVSIGAINAAAIAGAKDGDIAASLERLWRAITLGNNPFLPAKHQEFLSAFGNPNFFRLRGDWYNVSNWTSLCDISPMRRTLAELLDFDRINRPELMRLTVTATNVKSGLSSRFSNRNTRITPDHILASGSLPPGFPMTEIDGEHYWDGGLFDNTPLRPLVEMLTPAEAESLPIVVIDLIPTEDTVPANLLEIKNRTMEISFENRFWDDFGGPEGLINYAQMLGELDRELPVGSPVRRDPQYLRMMQYVSLRNLRVIESDHVPAVGGMDFSEYGVQQRFALGYQAAEPVIAEIKSSTAGAPAIVSAPVQTPVKAPVAAKLATAPVKPKSPAKRIPTPAE